jgi:plasmid maintenance system killer protein
VKESHVGESEDMTQNKEDEDLNMLVADTEFEELLKQFSLRLQAVHSIPQNSSMLSSAKSSRFLKLRPNVSNVWLH